MNKSINISLFTNIHVSKVHSASLFRCSHCEVFFKSKKGYEGHLQNKHGPRVVGSDGKPRSRKEMQGLNKVRSTVNLQGVQIFRACNIPRGSSLLKRHVWLFHC